MASTAQGCISSVGSIPALYASKRSPTRASTTLRPSGSSRSSGCKGKAPSALLRLRWWLRPSSSSFAVCQVHSYEVPQALPRQSKHLGQLRTGGVVGTRKEDLLLARSPTSAHYETSTGSGCQQAMRPRGRLLSLVAGDVVSGSSLLVGSLYSGWVRECRALPRRHRDEKHLA